MEKIIELATQNQEKAWNIIKELNIIDIWQSVGTEINLVGSMKTGLLVKNKDIDFHIYSSPISLTDSFRAITEIAKNSKIKRIEYTNLIDTEEHCIEWHAWYQDNKDEMWQIDMIHILKGSTYDGYFEKVSDRISAVLTKEMKQTILKLKYDTPDTEKTPGIAYYQAVIRDGITNYSDFKNWLKEQNFNGIIEWIP